MVLGESATLQTDASELLVRDRSNGLRRRSRMPPDCLLWTGRSIATCMPNEEWARVIGQPRSRAR